ncbi:MAG: ATP-binding protein [Streptosporangiaceae bacterium]|jgi:anti-sigma regulatory factor (Ser/Thr protein kinase)
MNAIAPTQTTELQRRRIPLPAGPAAAGEARRRVTAAVRAWKVPVDLDSAVLLTSELVTNALRHSGDGTVSIDISCSFGRLRVDVHDKSGSVPIQADPADDEETGRGLMLVETLSAEWGYYRTEVGKAVYFTLSFR